MKSSSYQKAGKAELLYPQSVPAHGLVSGSRLFRQVSTQSLPRFQCCIRRFLSAKHRKIVFVGVEKAGQTNYLELLLVTTGLNLIIEHDITDFRVLCKEGGRIAPLRIAQALHKILYRVNT